MNKGPRSAERGVALVLVRLGGDRGWIEPVAIGVLVTLYLLILPAEASIVRDCPSSNGNISEVFFSFSSLHFLSQWRQRVARAGSGLLILGSAALRTASMSGRLGLGGP